MTNKDKHPFFDARDRMVESSTAAAVLEFLICWSILSALAPLWVAMVLCEDGWKEAAIVLGIASSWWAVVLGIAVIIN